jgi:hypothetical protein
MWAFLSARFRMWLIMAVAVPVVGWLLGRIGDLIEARRGPNTLSKVLKTGHRWMRRRSRGPLAPRRPADPASVEDSGAPAR